MNRFEDIRDAANRLRGLQRQASTTVDRQDQDWQRTLVGIRRQTAAGIAELSAAARVWSAPGEADEEYSTLGRAVNKVRRTLAMHQALWPAVSIDPSDPQFRASVVQVVTAYDELFANLDAIERKLATAKWKKD